MKTVSRRPDRNHSAFTLAEMMVSCGVFAVATLGIWECARTVFYLSAKNTGINVSHSALQLSVDQLANQIRSSVQVIDVDNFDGTTFTPINEATGAGPSSAGNAVRFLRLLPTTMFVLPDDGSPFTQTNPQDPKSLLYPDYLAKGNKTVKVTFNAAPATLTSPDFLADLVNARFLPRFPYVSESVTTGSCPGTLPGLDLSATPVISAGTNTLQLTVGLPATVQVPSCNQAYLVIVSAAAVLNRGTSYAELLYYPDATRVSRSSSLTTALSPVATGSGPPVFALPKTAGAPDDPAARNSLQITLPVYTPNLNNTMIRRGGSAAMINVSVSLPVELRRRAQL